MILTTAEVPDHAALEALARGAGLPRGGYLIAVEGVVFDRQGRLVLMERGPGCRDDVGMLEGIGGEVENGEDFRVALLRELVEEVGPGADIEVRDFVHVRHQSYDEPGRSEPQHWLILSYLCAWHGGELVPESRDLNAGFVIRPADEMPREILSASARLVIAALGGPQSSLLKHFIEAFPARSNRAAASLQSLS